MNVLHHVSERIGAQWHRYEPMVVDLQARVPWCAIHLSRYSCQGFRAVQRPLNVLHHDDEQRRLSGCTEAAGVSQVGYDVRGEVLSYVVLISQVVNARPNAVRQPHGFGMILSDTESDAHERYFGV